MAVATAPERVRAPAAPGGVPDTARPGTARPDTARQPRPAIESPGRRGPHRSLRRTTAVGGALVLCSSLMVVAASAYLTQGQVRLTQMQQRLTAELNRHHDLEGRVAQLVDPSHVVAQAQRHGLTAPTRVTDLPQVNLTQTSTTTSTAPAARGASVPRTNGP
jgi:hypothetical protein